MCFHPIKAYKTFKANENGKHPLTFNPREGFEKIEVPCGKCIECRLKKAKMWSLRCVHEAQFHRDNCFITLTYNDEHLPLNNGIATLRYKDVQDFLKRLRKELQPKGIKFRYFCSAEYGGKFGRPHYHILLFGYKPDDLIPLGLSYSGMRIYNSPLIRKLWQNGFVFIGSVTQASAGYVARYTLEKFAKKEENFYEHREKEAIRMSRRNGLGFDWISKHWRNVAEVGTILLDNVKHSVPRFYRAFIEKTDPRLYKIMRRRLIKYAKKKYEELLKKYGNYLNVYYREIEREKYRLLSSKRLKRRLFKNNSHVGCLC